MYSGGNLNDGGLAGAQRFIEWWQHIVDDGCVTEVAVEFRELVGSSRRYFHDQSGTVDICGNLSEEHHLVRPYPNMFGLLQ